MATRSGILTRRATSQDAKGILACLLAAFEPYRARYTAGAFADTVLTPQTLPTRLAEMTVLVAVDDAGAVVGTISHAMGPNREGHIRGMAVQPDWEGHGVADQLLASAESALGREGCARITLDTTEPLRRAVRFYEKHGYRSTGKSTDFFGMPLFEYAKPLTEETTMPTKDAGPAEARSARVILSQRVIPAPRERVFRAWTDPKQLARWWGPKGFTNTFEQFEPRPGGNWRFVMHGPDGVDYRNESRFLEVVENERIVFKHLTGPVFQVTATFAEQAGQTKLTFEMLFDTVVACEHAKVYAVDANEQNFDRLEAELR